MNNTHVLQKTGILVTFEIAKRIPNSELKRIKKECSTLPKKDREAAFDEKIQRMGESIINIDDMPGIITPRTKAVRTENLLRYAIKLSQEIQNGGMSKEEQSFIITSIAKLLELKIKDFNNWKESQKDVNESESDYED